LSRSDRSHATADPDRPADRVRPLERPRQAARDVLDEIPAGQGSTDLGGQKIDVGTYTSKLFVRAGSVLSR
jgi:hypothetical protein